MNNNYLMRDAAPISADMWAKIDEMVVNVAKKTLVGRRFVELVGPLGWGVELVPLFPLDAEANAAKEMTHYVRLHEISQEFMLRAKHLAVAEHCPSSLDLGAVALAAVKLAKAEDDLVINKGLVQAAKTSAPLGDWSKPGAPFQAVAEATAQLLEAGCDGPYAIVMCPHRYAQLASLREGGMREIELVEKIAKGGIFQYPSMDCGQVLVLSLASWNFDLAVGQDVVTAYVGNEGLDQKFRIFETLALRVKRPEAICLLK